MMRPFSFQKASKEESCNIYQASHEECETLQAKSRHNIIACGKQSTDFLKKVFQARLHNSDSHFQLLTWICILQLVYSKLWNAEQHLDRTERILPSTIQFVWHFLDRSWSTCEPKQPIKSPIPAIHYTEDGYRRLRGAKHMMGFQWLVPTRLSRQKIADVEGHFNWTRTFLT